MTSPETTDPEVLAAAREALAKLDDDKYPLSAAATRKGENDEDIHIRVAIAAINEYRRSGSGVDGGAELAPVGWAYQDEKWLDGGRWHLCQSKPREFKGRRVEPVFLRSALAEPAAGEATLPLTRDTLGRMVREAWVRWARKQPSPKPSWLEPYDNLSESDKEVDRQIGEAVAKWTLIHEDAARSISTGQGGRAALAKEPRT